MAAARTLALALAAVPLARAAGSCGAEGSCPAPAERDQALIQVRQPAVAKGRCTFAVEPETPYFWDPNCTVGGLGCWADGVHAECRFCSYQGVPCPAGAAGPSKATCRFQEEPEAAYYWESQCPEIDGGLGCKADGVHDGCRYCGGEGAFKSVECKVEQCTFPNEPQIPYFWDETCTEGDLGCNADGMHLGCRYCGARPYESIECPKDAAVPETACWFRNEPDIPYYWDENCSMGMLGCWADGIHEKCRFCHCGMSGGKGGVYAEIPCPH